MFKNAPAYVISFGTPSIWDFLHVPLIVLSSGLRQRKCVEILIWTFEAVDNPGSLFVPFQIMTESWESPFWDRWPNSVVLCVYVETNKKRWLYRLRVLNCVFFYMGRFWTTWKDFYDSSVNIRSLDSIPNFRSMILIISWLQNCPRYKFPYRISNKYKYGSIKT